MSFFWDTLPWVGKEGSKSDHFQVGPEIVIQLSELARTQTNNDVRTRPKHDFFRCVRQKGKTVIYSSSVQPSGRPDVPWLKIGF